MVVGLVVLSTLTVSPVSAPSSPLPGSPAIEPAARAVHEAGLAVSIVSPGPLVDVGVPFTLRAVVAGGIPPLEYLWNSTVIGTWTQSNWTTSIFSATSTVVELTVADVEGLLGNATVTLTAVAPPSLGFTGPPTTEDTGLPAAVGLEVTSGVPPYDLGWKLSGNGSGGSTTVDTPGIVTEPVWSNQTGLEWLMATLVDAAGGESSISTEFATFVSPPQLSCQVTEKVVEAGQPFSVAGLLRGGAPPVNWSVESLAPLQNGSSASGELATGGSFEWTGTAEYPGNYSITVAATDRVGGESVSTIPLSVLPHVDVKLAILAPTGAVGEAVPLSIDLNGGSPPYTYSIQLSDGERTAGDLSAAVPLDWNATPGVPGYLLITVEVQDGAGAAAEADATVLVSAVPSPVDTGPAPSGSDLTTSAAELVLAAGLGVVSTVVILRRPPILGRRGHRPPALRGIETVERLLSDGSGGDLETLTYLAEEEGVDEAATRAAVDALVSQGRVRRESSPAGERLVWVPEPAPASHSPSEGNP